MKRAALLSLTLVPAMALADDVFLHGGGRVSGTIVERSPSKVVLETGPGLVTLPMSRVERIVEATSALSEYRRRARELAPTDALGWLALAEWARERELETQARAAYEKVLAADPGNAAAHQALGEVSRDGRWLTAEENYRERGFVLFEGRWVTREEQEAALRERGEAATAERARQEGEVRLREAEARVREAEARARAAEAEAQAPSFYPFAGGIVPVPVVATSCRPSTTRHTRAHRTTRAPAPAPAPRTIGPVDGSGSPGMIPPSAEGISVRRQSPVNVRAISGTPSVGFSTQESPP